MTDAAPPCPRCASAADVGRPVNVETPADDEPDQWECASCGLTWTEVVVCIRTRAAVAAGLDDAAHPSARLMQRCRIEPFKFSRMSCWRITTTREVLRGILYWLEASPAFEPGTGLDEKDHRAVVASSRACRDALADDTSLDPPGELRAAILDEIFKREAAP